MSDGICEEVHDARRGKTWRGTVAEISTNQVNSSTAKATRGRPSKEGGGGGRGDEEVEKVEEREEERYGDEGET